MTTADTVNLGSLLLRPEKELEKLLDDLERCIDDPFVALDKDAARKLITEFLENHAHG